MIKHFAIKSFKSILDASLDLGRVNVFIGANGSGKSNLLEAIGVLGAACSSRMQADASRLTYDKQAEITAGANPALWRN